MYTVFTYIYIYTPDIEATKCYAFLFLYTILCIIYFVQHLLRIFVYYIMYYLLCTTSLTLYIIQYKR